MYSVRFSIKASLRRLYLSRKIKGVGKSGIIIDRVVFKAEGSLISLEGSLKRLRKDVLEGKDNSQLYVHHYL